MTRKDYEGSLKFVSPTTDGRETGVLTCARRSLRAR